MGDVTTSLPHVVRIDHTPVRALSIFGEFQPAHNVTLCTTRCNDIHMLPANLCFFVVLYNINLQFVDFACLRAKPV